MQGELRDEQLHQLLSVIDTKVAPAKPADVPHETEETPMVVAQDPAWPSGATILELLLEATGACQWAPQMPQSHG